MPKLREQRAATVRNSNHGTQNTERSIVELTNLKAALERERSERRALQEQVAALFNRRVVIQEEERRKIARDVHDHVGQQLTALSMYLEALSADVEKVPSFSARVTRARHLAQQLDQSIDLLIRHLRSPAIEPHGLSNALEALVNSCSERFGIAAEYMTTTSENLEIPEDVATNLYYIAQEALHNVVKHARANCVSVSLQKRGGQVVLLIEDDGRGFNPSTTRQDAGTFGLMSMRERAALVECDLEIESIQGRGTTIYVRYPGEPNRTSTSPSSEPRVLPLSRHQRV